MRIRSTALALTTAVLFFGGIVLSMALNLWRTESTKVPASIRTGEFAGESDPADIRGSYTFGDIASHFDVSVEVLAEAFAVTGVDDLAAFRINSLEESYGELPDGGYVGTDSVRLFVARYVGLPHTPEETTRLPGPAASLLRERLDDASFEAIRAVTVTVDELKAASGEAAGDGTVVHATVEGETTIKGRTTFDELIAWGLTKEEIESILEKPMGARSATVREYLADLGLEFSTYRTKLQELVDSKK